MLRLDEIGKWHHDTFPLVAYNIAAALFVLQLLFLNSCWLLLW